MRSVTDAGRTGQLFYETVTDQSGSLSFSFPQGGCYKVFIVKEEPETKAPPSPSFMRFCGSLDANTASEVRSAQESFSKVEPEMWK